MFGDLLFIGVTFLFCLFLLGFFHTFWIDRIFSFALIPVQPSPKAWHCVLDSHFPLSAGKPFLGLPPASQSCRQMMPGQHGASIAYALSPRRQEQPKLLGLSALPCRVAQSGGSQISHAGKPKINVNLDITMIIVAQGNCVWRYL